MWNLHGPGLQPMQKSQAMHKPLPNHAHLHGPGLQLELHVLEPLLPIHEDQRTLEVEGMEHATQRVSLMAMHASMSLRLHASEA